MFRKCVNVKQGNMHGIDFTRHTATANAWGAT
jgi:hypothetical protein